MSTPPGVYHHDKLCLQFAHPADSPPLGQAYEPSESIVRGRHYRLNAGQETPRLQRSGKSASKGSSSNIDREQEPARATRFALRMAYKQSRTVTIRAISHEGARKATRGGTNQWCLPHGGTPAVQEKRERRGRVEQE